MASGARKPRKINMVHLIGGIVAFLFLIGLAWQFRVLGQELRKQDESLHQEPLKENNPSNMPADVSKEGIESSIPISEGKPEAGAAPADQVEPQNNPWDTDRALPAPLQERQAGPQQDASRPHPPVQASSEPLANYPELANGMLAVSEVQFPQNRAADMAAVEHGGSLSTFVARGGRFPIMMVTYNRAAMLRRSLEGLTAVRGVTKQDIYVVQDGAIGAVRAVLEEGGYQYHQKTDSAKLRGGRPMDGAQRIAAHYKYALSHIFETAAPWAPAVIVAEDDFLFSVDYYEYFHAIATVLEHDPNIWLASAWNDNGMRGCVSDMARLKRTTYFPGLGWLLPRAIWENQLAATWPTSHWDHFLRDVKQHRGREVLHPEVPRDYHFGIKGTFMDKNTHNKYFKPIAMAANNLFSWFSVAGEQAILMASTPAYSSFISASLQKGEVLNSVQAIEAFRGPLGIVYYSSPVEPNTAFRPMAAFFGIWHEPQRGARGGITDVVWGEGRLLLVNTHPSATQGLGANQAPPHARVLRGSDFTGRTRPDETLSNTAAKQSDPPTKPSSDSELRILSPLLSEQAEKAFYAEQYEAFGWDPDGGLVNAAERRQA